MNLPKVLIIGQPFNNDTGGGITLSNLFKNWDKVDLAVACSPYLITDSINPDICNKYYQLGYEETKWRFPFNLIQKKYQSGQLKFGEKAISESSPKKSKLRVKLIMDVFIPILHFLGLLHIISKTSISNQFKDWLIKFAPDVIYVQPTSRDGILFCLQVQSFLQKPLIFHIMDDWPVTITDNGVLKKFWSKKIDKAFRKLLDKADVLMSISGEMSRIYKIRYNKDFIPFHNTIDVDFWGRHQRKDYDLPTEPSILYAGRIGLGIESSLEPFALAIEKVNAEMKLSIKFVLQTPEQPTWIKNYSFVKHQKFGNYSDLPKIFSTADFLLLPYDFSPNAIDFIKYSMPTKAPEYMMSGTPIILFAPEETAIVKYCELNECAKIITENNVDVIADKLKDLIHNKSEREFIAKNAKKIASEEHDSIKVTRAFETVIKSLVPEKH